jgi:prolipoprotein diacylglyceryltransferase
MRQRPRYWSRRRSGASATTSTRSCSGARAICRGRWRSTPSTGPPDTAPSRPSIPRFLYELTWNLLLAAALVWLGRHRAIRPPGLFALYVAGYCGFRVVDGLLRVDPAAHVLGLRWNLLLALAGTVVGLAWFAATQRRPQRSVAAG